MVLPVKNKLALILSLVGVSFFLTLFFVVGYAYSNDNICIVKKGSITDMEFLDNQSLFLESVSQVNKDAKEALLRQFDFNTGLFTYLAHPNGATSEKNNAVRQLLASRVIAVESREDKDILNVHRRNVETILDTWYQEEEDRGYIYAFQKSKLGANSMFLRVLVASPYFEEYKEESQKLAEGILYLMAQDGSFKAWYKEPSYEYDEDYLLTFYSGEALLALIEYNKLVNDEALQDKILKSVDYYINAYVTQLERNYYPAYVPWHSQVLSALYIETKNIRYAEALFVLNDKVLELQDRTEFIGRFYNPATPEYGDPHASSDAVYTEGLVYAYEISREVGDVSREKEYREAIIRGFENLSRLQYKASRWNAFKNRDAAQKLKGGFVTRACNNWVRIDSTAHAVDAFTKIQEVWGGI